MADILCLTNLVTAERSLLVSAITNVKMEITATEDTPNPINPIRLYGNLLYMKYNKSPEIKTQGIVLA